MPKESGPNGKECCRKPASDMEVTSVIRSLVNATSLRLECAKVLHDGLIVTGLMKRSKTMVLKEKESPGIEATQIDGLSGLIGIKR